MAGKGGVGKTVTAATIASAASRAGQSVLLVEVAGRSASAPMFGTGFPGYEEAALVHAEEGHGEIRLRSITPDQALVEWLSTHGFNRLISRMSKSGLLEVVATATPGIKDLLVLGRIKAFEQERAADLIVVDAPSAGHTLGFLRSPTGVRDAARAGALHRQAVEVLELISDPTRCRVMLVTIAEETPVNELVETSFAVKEEVGVKLAPVVVNAILTELDGLDRLTRLDRSVWRAKVTASERSDLVTAAAFRSGRFALQVEQLNRLQAALPLEQLHLPHIYSTEIGPSELSVLTDSMLAAVEALPEPA